MLFALPSLSFALGLGDLKISSHLNEPLDATIPLDDVKGIEISDILPTIADMDEYSKAGFEAANWIYHINFAVVPNKQGKLVIKLTTQHPVQDPFADLLVKVTWPGGKIVREYTLLLDPPKIVTAQAKASVNRANEFIKSLSSPAVEAEAPRMVAQVLKQQYKEVRNDVSNYEPVQFGGRYGPVHDETLWSIARRLVENTHYSIHQAVMAIAYKNPDAFTNGNINHIKQGTFLKLPSQGEINKYSQEKAKNFVENQVQYGQSMPVQTIKIEQKEQKPKAQKKQEQPQAQTQPHKALKLIAPTQETENTFVSASTATATSNNPKEAGQVIQAPHKELSSQQLSLAEEALDTLKRSNEEITQKNSLLQSQNQSLTALLAQREAELTQLKSNESSSQHAPPPKESATIAMQPVQEYAVVTHEPDAHNKVRTEQNHLPTNSVGPEKLKANENIALAQNKNQDITKQNISAKEVPTEHSVEQKSKGNFFFIIFVIAFTLSILGWLWFSRHRFMAMGQWFTNKLKHTKTMLPQKASSSLVSDVPQEEIQVNYGLQFDLEKALSAVAKEERKFNKSQPITSLAKEDQEAIHKKSITSLEDAEIYIAYERYQQAERILQEILTTESAHEPIYWEGLLKLLELYVLTEKYQEYEKWYATVPSDLKEIAPKVWSKIMLLQEKVQADKAIPTQVKEILPQPKVEEENQTLTLATHHMDLAPSTPKMPDLPELSENVTAPKIKLELLEKDNDELNAQLALARTYQSVGDFISAKEVLQKMLESATDDKQKEQIKKMISELAQ